MNQFKEMAEETLNFFKEVSDAATVAIKSSPNDLSNPLVSGNTMVGNPAAGNLTNISNNLRSDYVMLSRQPAILRLIARDDAGELHTYFICRCAPISITSNFQFASYRSPIGKLAAQEPGDDFSLYIGDRDSRFHIIEKTGLTPLQIQGVWDSAPSYYEHEEEGAFTIESMLALLPAEAENAFEELLRDAESKSNVVKGFAHQTRSAMSLRDQPILDKVQDNIFRMPIDSKLLILGPPGTGKTTTLIKRLGLKLDKEFLTPSEKLLALDDPKGLPHDQSWIMFTPTELLKQYVKEAFSREQVPASNDRIQTWGNHRNHLARNVLGLLQSSTARGKFILKPENSYLNTDVEFDPRQWFDALKQAHTKRIAAQLNQGLKLLSDTNSETDVTLIRNISEIVGNITTTNIHQGFERLSKLEIEILPRLRELKEETDSRIRKSLVFLFNNNKEFLAELSAFIKTLDIEEDPDNEEQFDDDISEEQQDFSRSELKQAELDYTRAIRSIARYTFLKRSIPKSSKASAIRAWLADRILEESELKDIGSNIVIQNGLRRFVKPMRRYVTDIPSSFREFRKHCFDNEIYYAEKPQINSHISGSELDAIVYLTLLLTHELLERRYIKHLLDEPSMGWLSIIESQLRNQVLVDEFADFSVLQLGAIFNLSKGNARSFFCCGDFNQRIASFGTQSISQVEWACNGIESKTISIVYRQSQKLNEFAKSLLRITGGDLTTIGTLPKNHTHTGVSPALIENADNLGEITSWLADRIKEIETSISKMPTVAVLVNSESEVKPMAEKLSACLEDINLQAMPCPDGQSLGEGNDIRVFDAQHIKGLEFEAVFFVSIDELAKNKPDVFDKYLYVGSTRAATYLGVTCKTMLPESIKEIKEHFVESW